MKYLLLILFVCLSHAVISQQPAEEENPAASALEDSDNEEDNNENDYDLQQLERLRKHPVNINSDEVAELPLVDAELIANLNAYRKVLGDLIDVHELQAVPGFTTDIIRRLLPLITVNKSPLSKSNLLQRLQNNGHSFLTRLSYTLEKAKEFNDDSSSLSTFAGSRPAIMMRYKFQFRNLLQYGVVLEKDPGETFLHNNSPQFVSFHFFVRQLGFLKSFAIGDYTVNIGQGLIHWQGQAYKKSSGVINIKRQSELLRPYNSSGEYNFNRGIAATMLKNKTELTLFYSHRKLSGNVDEEKHITSIVTSGLFRTTSEMADRNNVTLKAGGASIRHNFVKGQYALNIIRHLYSLPLHKTSHPYNLFAIEGRSWVNYSFDYSYTYRNCHLFGEIAGDKKLNRAIVNGVIISMGGKMDLSALFRSINKSYQTLFGNAFTENTLPTNETGFYAGVSIKPSQRWKLDAYADLFSFPWLKYRLNSPAAGAAYLLQISYRPNKKTELSTRLRVRAKPVNVNDTDEFKEENIFQLPAHHNIYNWRMHLGTQLSKTLVFRSRMEVCRLSAFNDKQPGKGFLIFSEVHYRPQMSKISANVRIAAFEISSYEARIYSYENDLLFVNSIPALYNNGVRYYLNAKAKCKVNILSFSLLTVSVKLSSTLTFDEFSHSSNPPRATQSRNSAVKVQFFLSV